MADMKISDLPAAPNVNDAQQFEVNDAGASRRVSFQMLREKIATLFNASYAALTHSHTAEQISNATTTGRALMKADSAASARASIGAGTSNLALGTTASTAKAGNWKPNIDTETLGQLPFSRIDGAPSGTSLPEHLGVGAYIFGATTVKNINGGSNIAGSNLFGTMIRYAPNNNPFWFHVMGITLPGTWKNMSNITTYKDQYNTTLFMRIA